jgi:cell division protein FtsI/penicillin-binding protein 2
VTDWSLFKNPAVANQYEPGSTFKILSYSASIDAGAVTPDTTFNCAGTISVYGWPISNSEHRAHGTESMRDGFASSCNIAADFATTQLGEAGFYKYVQAFGIGSPTGIDIAGEVPGTLFLPGNENYSPINLYTNAFGQGVAVTPLQLITAVSAVANGGKLMKPYVVSSISRNGKVIQQNDPTVVRQVLKPETTAQVRDMMVNAVEQGIGKLGSVPGYRVAAKTGTAQVPGSAGYNGEGTLASAMAFLPAYDPKVVIYVLLNRPTSSMWGALTASPSMARLGAQLMQYYKIPPTEPIPPTPTKP